MMSEDKKEKAIIAQQLEDLHNIRRLRIGCPVYGSFYGLLKLQTAQLQSEATPKTTVKYSSGYYNAALGGLSPFPN